MALKTTLFGEVYQFRDVKDVLAKASEERSGDILAGVAAESAQQRVAAKQILANMTLHTLRGTVQISGLSAGPQERTYNLIVADFNTYFIGDSRTLTHDNTTRQPNNLVLPGMVWE